MDTFETGPAHHRQSAHKDGSHAPKPGPTQENAAASEPRFIDNYLAYLLAQASHRISREFHERVRAAGLSVPEWRVLASLVGTNGETIGELSYWAIIKQPTLSKIVHRMELDGLVERCRRQADRRQTRVRITAKGRALVEDLCRQALAHQKSVLAPLPPGHAQALIETLKLLIEQELPMTALPTGATAEAAETHNKAGSRKSSA